MRGPASQFCRTSLSATGSNRSGQACNLGFSRTVSLHVKVPLSISPTKSLSLAETVQLHLHDASLQASEVFVMQSSAKSATSAPHLPPANGLHAKPRESMSHVPSIATRIESLNICVEEVKAIIEIYFRSTPQQHAGLPFALHLCFAHAMQVLFTLNTLDDPDLDRETVLRCGAPDASQVLRQALEIMERTASQTKPTGGQRPHHFRRSVETVRANIDKWDAALKRTKGPTTLAASHQNTARLGPGAGTASPVDAAVQLYDPVLTEESDWLAELFTF